MSINLRILLLLIAAFLFKNVAISQSVEYYVGNKRNGIDLMWFKNFKNLNGEQSSFLFFSRNRSNVDYHDSPTVLGSTNAISYNFKNGLGIVTVASFLNSGFVPKAGFQFYKQKGDFMFFGWIVADIKKEGNIDIFGLFRYQPKINEQWNVFNQIELFPVYNPSSEFWNITQRIRLGVKYQNVAFGLMTDLNQSGMSNFTTTENIGGFLRYEFN